MRKLGIAVVFLALFLSSSAVVLAQGSIQCTYRAAGNCQADEEAVMYASGNLSAHTRINTDPQSTYPVQYPYSVCCKSQYGSLGFDTIEDDQSCGAGEEELMYYTNETNSRVAFDFVDAHHSHKLCVSVPDGFSNLDIVVNNSNYYDKTGYTCIFKTNALENGHISSCDATFDSNNQYTYTVWARLFENLNSLQCNADCTSKLDNRVYSACGQKIRGCSNVPSVCDGSLKGAWVPNPLNMSQEIKCAPPWDMTRTRTFTDMNLDVEASDEECDDVITKTYSVMVNNEPVSMNIYVCEEGEEAQ